MSPQTASPKSTLNPIGIAMEDFIRTKLHPTETCTICTDAFSTKHPPVVLNCKHIFGHGCIKEWLRSGTGNTNSCPICRQAIYPSLHNEAAFTDESIWQQLCLQTPENMHTLMCALWERVLELDTDSSILRHSPQHLLEHVVVPALRKINTKHYLPDVFHDAHDIVVTTWNSLGRRELPRGLAVPLVRLVSLMLQTSSILPKWMATVPRTSTLFWDANAALGMSESEVKWAHVMDASSIEGRYEPLLHLYTVLISQNIAHSEPYATSPRQQNVRTQIIERCCRRIGGQWGGRPSEEFKDQVVRVFGQLRRHQVEGRKVSLRGHPVEKAIIKGLWAMARWKREDAGRVRAVSDAAISAKKTMNGWGE